MAAQIIERHVAIHLAAAKLPGADIRTIAKVYDGRPVRGLVGEVIRRALLELGVNPPAPAAITRNQGQIA